MEKFERVLELMKQKGGRIEGVLSADGTTVTWDADVKALLGRLEYRLAVYVSYIRRFSCLEVKNIRQGRKVVAYELVVADPTAPAEANGRYRMSKYLQKEFSSTQAAATS